MQSANYSLGGNFTIRCTTYRRILSHTFDYAQNTPLHMAMKPHVLMENLQCAYSECYSKQNQNKVKGSYSSVTSMYAFMRSGAHTYNTAGLIGCIHVRT